MYVIGVDIGGTSLRIGMIDESGNLSAFEKIGQGTVLTGDSVHELGNFIEQYIIRHEREVLISGLAVAFPAPLDKEKAVVLNAPNIAGFNEKPVKKLLQKRFSFPVYLLKDVSALYYYDKKRFEIDDEGVVIGCYIGTGIGNAIAVGGRLLDGENGAAGELGHIPVWGAAGKCGCGNTGCMETVAGGRYLSHIQQEKFSETPIDKLFAEHGDNPILQEYIHILAMAVATEINILDPKTVLLGGGVVSMEDFPAEKLEETIRKYARKPLPEKNLRFLYADNKGENGVIGAGIYLWEKNKECVV